MEDVEKLLKCTVEELERLLNAQNVLGDPIRENDVTIVPLVSYGFGFGAGGGAGPKAEQGGGTGAGGGIKPQAAIIIDKESARLEPLKGGVSSAIEALGDVAVKAMNAKQDNGA